jgi:hypothetical protein
MRRRHFAISILAAVAISGVVGEVVAKVPDTSGNLVRVKSSKLEVVYLAPGADFRPYTQVILDPTVVTFDKKWQKEQNSRSKGTSGRITDADMQKAIDKAVQSSSDIFAKAFAKGGYPVVTTPGPHVLKVSTAIANIRVTSPDVMTAGRSSSYASTAGQAHLVVEARDSTTGAILGRAIDARLAGDNSIMMRRTSVSNRADFEHLIADWARISVRGLNDLKASSPHH